jgi:CheY-like chemotaxis protein
VTTARPALFRILYIEDEPDIQQVVKLALETVGGYAVRTCGSTREAVDSILEFRPQLILLDYMMPETDGRASLEILRRIPESASTPVVFVTARVQSHEVDQYRKMGALDVVSKPFDPMSLSKVIGEIWDRARE